MFGWIGSDMPHRAFQRHRLACLVAYLATIWITAGGAHAASLSEKDVHVISKVLGFLDPAPTGGTVAVVYASGDAASKADADGIAALFGGGLAVGAGSVTA